MPKSDAVRDYLLNFYLRLAYFQDGAKIGERIPMLTPL